MSSHLRLKPNGLENNLTNVTVTLLILRQYARQYSVKLPECDTAGHSLCGSAADAQFTLTILPPQCPDRDGVKRIAAFNADQAPDRTLFTFTEP